MAVDDPWHLDGVSLRKGRKSVYYERWMDVIRASPPSERYRSRLWPMLSAMWEAQNKAFRFGTRTKADQSMRALKAAVIDGLSADVTGSGCIINRWLDAPTFD